MDALDIKLNKFYPGKVVRKDLVHDIKKAANVPSFVLLEVTSVMSKPLILSTLSKGVSMAS